MGTFIGTDDLVAYSLQRSNRNTDKMTNFISDLVRIKRGGGGELDPLIKLSGSGMVIKLIESTRSFIVLF